MSVSDDKDRQSKPLELTRLLREAQSGDARAIEAVSQFVYETLRGLAKKQRRGRLFCTTELAHEAYVRLFGGNGAWNDRRHFSLYAAKAIRSIVVDRARKLARREEKMSREYVPLDALVSEMERRSGPLEELDERLTELEAMDDSAARLIELHVFGGLSQAEAAESVGVSLRTTERKIQMARAWLRAKMTHGRGTLEEN